MKQNPTTITYDGKVIAIFGAGQTATLKTKGDAMQHDIIVTAGSGTTGSGTSVISDRNSIIIEKAAVMETGENTITIGG